MIAGKLSVYIIKILNTHVQYLFWAKMCWMILVTLNTKSLKFVPGGSIKNGYISQAILQHRKKRLKVEKNNLVYRRIT